MIVYKVVILVVVIYIDKILRVCNLFKKVNFRFVIEFLNKYEKDWWSVIYVGRFLKMYFCI